MPARFRISYEDRDEDPLDGREMFFDDIANPDPEVGAVGLWAIGDTNDRLLDCHTLPAAETVANQKRQACWTSFLTADDR